MGDSSRLIFRAERCLGPETVIGSIGAPGHCTVKAPVRHGTVRVDGVAVVLVAQAEHQVVAPRRDVERCPADNLIRAGRSWCAGMSSTSLERQSHATGGQHCRTLLPNSAMC